MKETEFPMQPRVGLFERHSQINVVMLKNTSLDASSRLKMLDVRVDVMSYENACDFIKAPSSIKLYD